MEYRKHLQAFIDRWRYNANRGIPFHIILIFEISLFSIAAQAQMKIKILEKVFSVYRTSDLKYADFN